MLALHKFCGPDTKEDSALHYIQVKPDFTCVSDHFILAKIPTPEVFGPDVITDEEELYFDSVLWKNNKFDKANEFERDGDTFTAFSSKGVKLGQITALHATGLKKKYPDFGVAIPKDEPVAKFGINPSGLKTIADVFGQKALIVQIHKGPTFTIGLTSSISQATIAIAGNYISKAKDVSEFSKQTEIKPQQEDEVNRLKSELRDLEMELEDQEQVHDAQLDEQKTLNTELEDKIRDLEFKQNRLLDYEGYSFTAESEQERQLFIEFIDLLKNVKPAVLFETFGSIKLLA